MATQDEKELKQTDPEFLPVQYDMRKAQIRKLKKEYDPALIPEANAKGDEGYLVIHEKAMAIVKVRTGIDAKRKTLKADALAWGKQVDDEAKRLTAMVEELEKPWKEKKAALDEKEAREAEEARQAELKRIQIIEDKVEQLKSATNNLLGVPVEQLKEKLSLINAVVIDDLYGEYVEVAQEYKDTAIAAITSGIKQREEFEAQQAEMLAAQEKIAEQQRILDEQQAKIDAQEKAIADAEKPADLVETAIDETLDEIKSSPVMQQQTNNASNAAPEPKANGDVDALAKYIEAIQTIETPILSNPGLQEMLNDSAFAISKALNNLYEAIAETKAA